MIPALLKCATPYRQREDSSIFTAGGAFLPAKNRQSIRQRLFRVDVGLPPQDKTKLGSPKKYPQIKVFSQYIITVMTETLKNQNTHEHLWSMETVHMFCI
jgi:hypothetical protein